MPDLRKSQLARKNIFWFIAPRPPKNLNFLLSHRRRRICGGVRKVENARVRRMRKYSFNNWSFSLFFTGFFFFIIFFRRCFSTVVHAYVNGYLCGTVLATKIEVSCRPQAHPAPPSHSSTASFRREKLIALSAL